MFRTAVYRFRPFLAAVLLSAACVSPAAPASNTAAAAPRHFDLPPVTGPYRVGTTTLHLIDRSRTDPFVGGAREWMVTVSYPIAPNARGPRAPWIDPALAPVLDASMVELGFAPGAVDWAGARRPATQGAPLKPMPGGWPVVLFSPGLQYYREVYSSTTDDLASHGYVVASMTHTYEAFFTAFPGGRIARGVALTETVESTQMWLDTRVADARYTLDALSQMNYGRNPDAGQRPLPLGWRGGLDLSRVGFYGHSYGGTTAAETMFFDRRFDAGIDFDGRLSTTYGPPQDLPYGPTKAARYGLSQPFLLMGAQGYSHVPAPTQDRSWVDFWGNQRGWKREVQARRGMHFSFSDFPAILSRLGDATPAGLLEAANGTLPPDESVAATRAYVRSFFDLHLKHRPTRMFERPHPAYPNFQPVP
ncbi:MAG: hypothetical protein ACREP7_05345 [Lysobacter sp.]